MTVALIVSGDENEDANVFVVVNIDEHDVANRTTSNPARILTNFLFSKCSARNHYDYG